jgi:hypothetical protein
VNRKGTPLSGSEPWALSPHPATSLTEIFPQKPTMIRTDNLRHTAPSFIQPIIHNEPTRTKSCSYEERNFLPNNSLRIVRLQCRYEMLSIGQFDLAQGQPDDGLQRPPRHCVPVQTGASCQMGRVLYAAMSLLWS